MSSYRRDNKAFRARMAECARTEVVVVTDYPRTPATQARPVREAIKLAFVLGLIVVGFRLAVMALSPVIRLIVWGS